MNKSIKEYIESYNAGHSEALKRIPLVKRLEREEIYKEILEKLPEKKITFITKITSLTQTWNNTYLEGFNQCLDEIKSILTPPK